MARTIVGVGDAKAVQKWATALAVDTARASYFSRKFMSSGANPNTPIQLLTHLENDAGDKISFDLSMQLVGQPIEGDNRLEGNEEALTMYTDAIYIDQTRCAVSTGGRMTNKRTLHDLRTVAKQRMSEWWARFFDELIFIYLSGARGINTDYILPLGYTGRAGNALAAPDSNHIAYGGNATQKSDVDANDKMDVATINKLVAKADTIGGGSDGIPQIQPVMVEGSEHYILVMHPWQEYDLRASTSTGEWLDIQKALATSEGRNSPLVKGGLGLVNNVVLHSHRSVIRYSDYGVGTVKAARALFMGRQAATCAFGTSGSGLRYGWVEQMKDYENELAISSYSIFGIKKTRFNSQDFGVIAVDTAAASPY